MDADLLTWRDLCDPLAGPPPPAARPSLSLGPRPAAAASAPPARLCSIFSPRRSPAPPWLVSCV